MVGCGIEGGGELTSGWGFMGETVGPDSGNGFSLGVEMGSDISELLPPNV